jgi:hypothetical protein
MASFFCMLRHSLEHHHLHQQLTHPCFSVTLSVKPSFSPYLFTSPLNSLIRITLSTIRTFHHIHPTQPYLTSLAAPITFPIRPYPPHFLVKPSPFHFPLATSSVIYCQCVHLQIPYPPHTATLPLFHQHSFNISAIYLRPFAHPTTYFSSPLLVLAFDLTPTPDS